MPPFEPSEHGSEHEDFQGQSLWLAGGAGDSGAYRMQHRHGTGASLTAKRSARSGRAAEGGGLWRIYGRRIDGGPIHGGDVARNGRTAQADNGGQLSQGPVAEQPGDPAGATGKGLSRTGP